MKYGTRDEKLYVMGDDVIGLANASRAAEKRILQKQGYMVFEHDGEKYAYPIPI